MNRRIRSPLSHALALAPALALGLSLIAACDDSGEQRKDGSTVDGKAVPGDGKGATPPELRKFKNPAEAITAYNKCYSECFTSHQNATNRETCKLNCDGVAEAALEGLTGAPPKDDFMKALSAFNGCVDACYGDKTLSATNRATCVLTCQDAAEVAASAPPKGADPAAPAAPAAPPPAAAGAQ